MKTISSNIRSDIATAHKIETHIVKKLQELKEIQNSFSKFVVQEESRLSSIAGGGYLGYKDTSGDKYETVEAMVANTGKAIRVNGILFPSCGSAASYIIEIDTTSRSKSTVSKRLRTILNGKHKFSTLYNRFEITPA